MSGVGVRRDVLCRNERLRPSFHAVRLLPLSLSVAGHPRDPDALPEGGDRCIGARSFGGEIGGGSCVPRGEVGRLLFGLGLGGGTSRLCGGKLLLQSRNVRF